MQSLNLPSVGSPLLAIFMRQDGEACCCCCCINGLYLRRYSNEGKEKDLGKVNSYSFLSNSRDCLAHHRVGIAFSPSLPPINHQQR